MKKLAVLLMCAALATGTLVACGESKPSSTGTNTQQSTPVAAEGFAYDLNGTKVTPNAEMAPIAEALGEPTNYFESESCAFQGLDKVYTYGSVVITTYPENEKDYVFTIELKDDTVSTPEGICIGASADDVKAAYGTATTETEGSLVFTKGNSTLSFILADGAVTNIVYTAITE